MLSSPVSRQRRSFQVAVTAGVLHTAVCVTAVSLLTETCPQRPAWLGRQAGEHTHRHTG